MFSLQVKVIMNEGLMALAPQNIHLNIYPKCKLKKKKSKNRGAVDLLQNLMTKKKPRKHSKVHNEIETEKWKKNHCDYWHLSCDYNMPRKITDISSKMSPEVNWCTNR